MQIKTDDRKKTKKFLSFKSFNASKPKISDIDTLASLFLGGVLGSRKLKIPRTKEAIEVTKNVFANKPSAIEFSKSHANKLISTPATTHRSQIVPSLIFEYLLAVVLCNDF